MGYVSVKTQGFSLTDIVERLKRVYGVVDNIVVTPLITHVKGSSSDSKEVAVTEVPPVAAPAPAKAAPKKKAKKAPPPPKPASVTDEDEMHDASEEVPVA